MARVREVLPYFPIGRIVKGASPMVPTSENDPAVPVNREAWTRAKS